MVNYNRSICTYLIVCCCLLGSSVGWGATKFVTPLSGTPFVDWTIGNYVDTDPRPIARSDYRGGKYTYDGHDGIDFGLAHFRAMEAGIDVLAAASGTVINVIDGAYDRWTGSNPAPPGEVGNLIVVDHGQGLTTLYGHLQKDSTSVQVGDFVDAGQPIAQVGSSGGSTGPHLHFSVRQNGHPVATYLNPEQWWEDPLRYTADQLGALDSGIAKAWPTQSEVEAGIEHQSFFSRADGPGQLVVIWNHLFGISKGDDISLRLLRPSGSTYSNFQWTEENGLYVGFWNHGIQLPSLPDLGVWQSELRVNGEIISESSFHMIDSVSGDFNSDGRVNGEDFLEWQRNTNIGELADWQQNFGSDLLAIPIAGMLTVPEPQVLAMVTTLILYFNFLRLR